MMGTSCRHCIWLFTRDTGYSNWTVLDTEMHCARRMNPRLPAKLPSAVQSGSRDQPALDKWHATRNGRCQDFRREPPDVPLPFHHIDCDGEEIPTPEQTVDAMLSQADPVPQAILDYFAE